MPSFTTQDPVLVAIQALRADINIMKADMGSMKADIKRLQTSTDANFQEVKTSIEGVRTTQRGHGIALDTATEQLAELVQDISTGIVEKINRWGAKVESRVIDKVLAIHSPRIEAAITRVQEKKSCECSPRRDPTTVVATCDSPCRCSHRSMQAEEASDANSSRTRSSVSSLSYTSGSRSAYSGTFGNH